MTPANPARPTTAGRAFAAVPRTVVVALGAAVLVEFVILRLISRVAIHVPAPDSFVAPYRMATSTGRFALSVASVSLIVLLAVLAWRGFASRDFRGLLVAAGVVLFALGAGLARVGADNVMLMTSLLIAAVVMAGLAAVATRWSLVWCVGPLCLAAWLGGVYVVLQDLGASATLVRWLPAATEVPVLAAALVAPAVFRIRRDRLTLFIGATVGILVLLAFLANPWTTRILLLWSDGLPGRFPGVVYAVAGGAYVATIVGVARRGQLDTGVALGLLLAAGVAFQNTYQTGLMVAALAVLASSASRQDGLLPNPILPAMPSPVETLPPGGLVAS